MHENPRFADMAVIILAAGKGTRMKSEKAKVLHELLGSPMILHVLGTAKAVGGSDVILVVGHQAERVRKIVSERHEVRFALQKEQLGTGHAVLCALSELPEHAEDVLILCGDVPLISPDTLFRLAEAHRAEGRDISLLAVNLDEPTGYGRLIAGGDSLVAGIVEEADATPEQKKIGTVNAGIYCVKTSFLKHALEKIDSDNAQREFYLTDIVGIGHRAGKRVGMLLAENPEEVAGINTLRELARAESLMKSGKIS